MNEINFPTFPELGFEKINSGYFFESQRGKLILQTNERYFMINEIQITVSDSINVSFQKNQVDYQTIWGVNGNVYSRQINIVCNSQEYLINLCDCFEDESMFDEDRIHLNATQIRFIKNDKKIKDYEIVNVWNILESQELSEKSILSKFKHNDLKNIFLKSIKNSQNSIEITLFNQLLNRDAFLFYKTKYGDIGNDSMTNIEKMLMFFDADIQPIRMRIIENETREKLEIIIDSKFFKNPKVESIFVVDSLNFVDFIQCRQVDF